MVVYIEEQLQFFRLLRSTKSAIEKATNSELKKVGLTIAQGHITLFLQAQNDHQATLKDLEMVLQVAQSTVVLMVSKLEKKGFVMTYNSAVDRRVKYVVLTNKGKKCAAFVLESMANVQNEALASINESERLIFLDLLARINNKLDKKSKC